MLVALTSLIISATARQAVVQPNQDSDRLLITVLVPPPAPVIFDVTLPGGAAASQFANCQAWHLPAPVSVHELQPTKHVGVPMRRTIRISSWNASEVDPPLRFGRFNGLVLGHHIASGHQGESP